MLSGKGQLCMLVELKGGLKVWGWCFGHRRTQLTMYHDEMNSEHYIEWLTEQLLPQLDRPTVIILDNASYHNKQRDKPPTSKTRSDSGLTIITYTMTLRKHYST